jgi:c-di-GMP-binding flagellar brake protein YcgR
MIASWLQSSNMVLMERKLLLSKKPENAVPLGEFSEILSPTFPDCNTSGKVQMLSEDRREYYRLPIRVPIFIKGTDNRGREFLELTHTVNVSASGACFVTKQELQVSGELMVSIPAPVSTDYGSLEEYDFKFPAKVVRLENGLINPSRRVSVRFAKLLYERVQ